MSFRYHAKSSAFVDTDVNDLFEYLDDPRRLSSHMGKSSMMMAGSKMDMRFDQKNGRGQGAEIILEGKMLGIPLYVREYVIESLPPKRKVWATEGVQKMIVIDQYQMGFEVSETARGTKLDVFIDYDLPVKGASLILGKAFGHVYARWCVKQMTNDAAKYFKSH